MNLDVSQSEERSSSGVWWYDDTSVTLVRWQWGEQAVAGNCLLISFGLYADTSPISLIFGRWAPMMFWVFLITCCRAFLSWVVHKPRQIVMFPVSMLSIAPLSLRNIAIAELS